MARSVILNPTRRCARCHFIPRWCICAGHDEVDLPLQVDVLMHKREQLRPTSTGKLINRVIPSSRKINFESESPPTRSSVALPGKNLLILHPKGDPLPPDVSPERVQLLLLDGTWREATRMAQTVSGWGRLVSLPMTEPGRYWLRKKQGGVSYSTFEALLHVLDAFGLKHEKTRLRRQFELHVYAGLRSRGILAVAEKFLESSPLRDEFPELIEELHRRRPLT